MRRLIAAIGLVLAVLPAQGLAAQITPRELSERAERARETAREAVSNPSPARMAEVRRELGLPAQVRLGGEVVELPADAYLEGLDGDGPRDFTRASEHLAVIGDTLRDAAAARPEDEAALRADLERAYADVPRARPTLWDRAWGTVLTFLGRLFRGVADQVTSPLAWLILGAVLVAVVLALRRLGLRPVPAATVPRPSRPPSGAEWRTRAEEARARGDLGEAVACLYRSLVAALGERGLVEDRPSLTPGEVRAGGLRAPTLAAEVNEATVRYERVRYGEATATDEDVAALAAAERRASAA